MLFFITAVFEDVFREILEGRDALSFWNGEFQEIGFQVSESSTSEYDHFQTTFSSIGLAKICYELVMEYFGDFKEVDWKCLDIPATEAIGRALTRIHTARVTHSDMAERNILLVREARSVQVVWIDFTCVWLKCSARDTRSRMGIFLAKLY